MNKDMTLTNAERLALLSSVKAEIIKGCNEQSGATAWNGDKYVKVRAKYGLAKMTTLYSLEAKLSK